MNYLPHHTKKKQALAQRERDLMRLMERGGTIEKLVNAATEVRDARIRVLRAKRATIAPKGDSQKLFDKIDVTIRGLEIISPRAILVEFGFSDDGA